MKTLKYIILAIIIFLIIFSCNSKSTSGQVQSIVIQSNVRATSEQLSISKDVITNRLKALQTGTFEITQDVEKSQLVVKFNDTPNVKDLSEVFIRRGVANFCLALSNQEVTSTFAKLDQKQVLEDNVKVADLLQLLGSGSLPKGSAVIGFVDAKDTALVFKCLKSKSVSDLLPVNSKFIWGQAPNYQGKYELYAVNTQNAISGKMIKDASISTSKSFKTEINLSFNEPGTALWKEMTSKNLGKSVAMVIDNKVYSAPTVRSEIPNGKCIITGNYHLAEMKHLAAIIKGGSLTVDFKLIEK